MIKNLIFLIIAILISGWLFNHINSWLGIATSILALVLYIYSLKPTIKKMKKQLKQMLFIALITFTTLTSCSRVAPNYYGVLMENYGKNGKSDYSEQKGRVNTTFSAGTELFQVPAFEQRAEFNKSDGTKQLLKLKAADNTEFNASPLYSYKVIESKVIDVVFENSRLGNGDGFMKALEDNVLEPHIYDIIKEESRKYITDTLMANGGSLKFETIIQDIVKKSFAEKGLELITFSANLDFSDKVKQKIDTRNEVNTNVSVIDQQIVEQRKRNELAELQAQEQIIKSKGLTPQILQQEFLNAWKITKQPIYGNIPITLFKNQ
jgi:energy-coupling factor transporter transmembrane protein EcfT